MQAAGLVDDHLAGLAFALRRFSGSLR
jgi:hypothetical protein